MTPAPSSAKLTSVTPGASRRFTWVPEPFYSRCLVFALPAIAVASVPPMIAVSCGAIPEVGKARMCANGDERDLPAPALIPVVLGAHFYPTG